MVGWWASVGSNVRVLPAAVAEEFPAWKSAVPQTKRKAKSE